MRGSSRRRPHRPARPCPPGDDARARTLAFHATDNGVFVSPGRGTYGGLSLNAEIEHPTCVDLAELLFDGRAQRLRAVGELDPALEQRLPRLVDADVHRLRQDVLQRPSVGTIGVHTDGEVVDVVITLRPGAALRCALVVLPRAPTRSSRAREKRVRPSAARS